MKRIYQILKNKKGITSIELAICVFIFIIALCGFIDLTSVLDKTNAVSETSTYVARTIGHQGGIKTSKPANFSGEYVTTSELYNNVKKSLESTGIGKNEWTFTINGIKITSSTNLELQNFGSYMKVEISINYTWDLVSNFIPGQVKQTKTAERNVMSTYKVRNSGFVTG